MSRRILIFLVLCLIGLSGCVRPVAEPFVTDIAFDGDGNLLVTTNVIIHSQFAGFINIGDNPQTIVIKAPKNNGRTE